MNDPTKRTIVVVICGLPVADLGDDGRPVLFDDVSSGQLAAIREVIRVEQEHLSYPALWDQVADLIDKKLGDA